MFRIKMYKNKILWDFAKSQPNIPWDEHPTDPMGYLLANNRPLTTKDLKQMYSMLDFACACCRRRNTEADFFT